MANRTISFRMKKSPHIVRHDDTYVRFSDQEGEILDLHLASWEYLRRPIEILVVVEGLNPTKEERRG